MRKKTVLSKVDDITPFKGGLAQIPIIVGLLGKVNDKVNNLISKFVGYQSKTVKEMMLVKKEIWQPNKLNLNILRRKNDGLMKILIRSINIQRVLEQSIKRQKNFSNYLGGLRKGCIANIEIFYFLETLEMNSSSLNT